ncbi:MAG TPA: MarR family transcriptional regulator [Candidatus Dormibacteraeota bacterium]|nr:MarR family transcriptional regulator [Candidatus Dormibacteraeota bacterium]
MARELKPTEFRAWQAFLDAQATVLRRLEADLVAADGMTLAEFDVLIQLRLAADRRLRMTDLSERVRLSPSGVTRLVDRLAREGLIKRLRCASDRRGTWAILTAAGRERIDRVTPIHLRGVRDYFARRISSGQMSNLAAALEGVARDRSTSVSSAS